MVNSIKLRLQPTHPHTCHLPSIHPSMDDASKLPRPKAQAKPPRKALKAMMPLPNLSPKASAIFLWGKKTTDPRWRPHGDPRWRPHHGERGVVLRGEVPGVGGGVVRWTTKTSNYIRWFFWYGVAFLYWVIKFSKREKILTVNNRREAETHHHVHQQSQAGPFGNLLTYQGSKS